MKLIEKIFLVIFCLIAISNCWITDNEVTQPLFGFMLIIYTIIYLFFGYFIFKSSNSAIKNNFQAILNGVFVAIGLVPLFVKLIIPTYPLFLSILCLPLVLLTLYYRKKATTSSADDEVVFYRHLFRKNSIYTLIFILIIIFPAQLFTRILYGYNSPMYYETSQTLYLKQAEEYRKDSDIEQSKQAIKKALHISSIRKDESSALYQQCLNEFGKIYYEEEQFEKADSVFNEVLALYELDDYRLIKRTYDEELQIAYFDAIYTDAQVNYSWGNYKTSDSLYRIAIQYFTNDINLAYIYSDMGKMNSKLGKYNIADEQFKLSINYHKKTDFEDKQHFLSTFLAQSLNKIKSSNFDSAENLLNRCYIYAKKEFGFQDIEVAGVLDGYVTLYMKKAKYNQAEKYCIESLKIKEATYGKRHAEYIDSELDLVSIYIAKSKYKEAKKLLEELEGIIKKHFNSNSSISIRLYDALNYYYEDYLEYDKAQSFAEKSLKSRIFRYGKYNLNTAISYHNLAAIYYYKHHYYYADSLYKLAASLRKHYTGTESAEFISSFNGLGLVLISRDSLVTAEKYLNFCEATYKSHYSTAQPDYATILGNLAALKIRQHIYPNAEKNLLKALDIDRSVFGEKHIKIAHIYHELSELYYLKGNQQLAKHYLKKSYSIYQNLLGNSHFFVKQLTEEIKNLP